MTDASEGAPLSLPEGLRVLLVEDNYLVASNIQHMLERLGCVVVGPVPSVAKGCSLLESEPVDAAVLDVNIIGGSSEPIAHRLTELGRPFIFITGYASPPLKDSALRGRRRLNKPIVTQRLVSALQMELQSAADE